MNIIVLKCDSESLFTSGWLHRKKMNILQKVYYERLDQLKFRWLFVFVTVTQISGTITQCSCDGLPMAQGSMEQCKKTQIIPFPLVHSRISIYLDLARILRNKFQLNDKLNSEQILRSSSLNKK